MGFDKEIMMLEVFAFYGTLCIGLMHLFLWLKNGTSYSVILAYAMFILAKLNHLSFWEAREKFINKLIDNI